MGSRLHSKLEELKYDSSNFNKSSFDWMFENRRVSPFLEWICDTITPKMVLSEHEAKTYDELLQKQTPLLTGDKLTAALESYEADARETELKTRARIELLTAKKLALMQKTQKLQQTEQMLRNQVKECEERKKAALKIPEKTTSNLDYPEQWLSHVKQAQETFHSIATTSQKEKPLLMSQQNLTQYLATEKEYNEALKGFISRQFFNGMGDLGHNEGVNRVGVWGLDDPFVVDGLSDDVQTRLRHSNHLAFLQTKLMEKEEDRLYHETVLAATRGSLMKAQEFQELLQKKQFTSLSSRLTVDVENLPVEVASLRTKWRTLRSSATESLQQNVQQLCSRVTVGDCRLKLYRQEYYMKAQKALWNLLKSQWARNELLVMVLRVEGKALGDVFHFVQNLINDLRSDVQQCREKEAQLRNNSTDWQSKLERNTFSSNNRLGSALCTIMGKHVQSNLITFRMFTDFAARLKSDERNVANQLEVLRKSETSELLLLSYLVEKLMPLTDCQSSVQAAPISRATNEVGAQLSKVESAVKPLNKELEKKRLMLESDSLVAQEHVLWKHFYTDPQALLKMFDAL